MQIEGKAIDHVYVDDDGEVTRLLLNGPFQAVLTNLTTGEALAPINISGSLDTRFNEEGSRSVTIRGRGSFSTGPSRSSRFRLSLGCSFSRGRGS